MRVGSDRADDYDQIFLRDSLIRGGMDPVQAEREAAMRVLREKRERALASMPRTADGRPALGEDEAAFDSAMAMAMGQAGYGNGADIDNLAAAATPVVMDAGLGVPQSERVFKDDPTQGLAGVLAAREAAAARNWEERGAHYGNPDPAARGMVRTLNPETGEIGYSVAHPADTETAIGGPGRPGWRPDLSGPVTDTATGQPIPGTTKYVRQMRQGPDGEVAVYAPSPALQQEVQQREGRQRIRRLATRAGFTPESAAFMSTSGEPQNLDQLRAMGDARRDVAMAARQQAVIRRAQAQSNPLEYMNRSDVSDWNKMVAADAMLRRGYRGATPLDVEQAAETAKALQQQRMALGQGFQQPSEAQVRGANAAADAKEAEVAGEIMKAARSIVGEYADNKGWMNLLSRINPMTSGVDFHDPTVFTEEERVKALTKLLARFPHLSPEEAAKLLAAASADTTPQP